MQAIIPFLIDSSVIRRFEHEVAITDIKLCNIDNNIESGRWDNKSVDNFEVEYFTVTEAVDRLKEITTEDHDEVVEVTRMRLDELEDIERYMVGILQVKVTREEITPGEGKDPNVRCVDYTIKGGKIINRLPHYSAGKPSVGVTPSEIELDNIPESLEVTNRNWKALMCACSSTLHAKLTSPTNSVVSSIVMCRDVIEDLHICGSSVDTLRAINTAMQGRKFTALKTVSAYDAKDAGSVIKHLNLDNIDVKVSSDNLHLEGKTIGNLCQHRVDNYKHTVGNLKSYTTKTYLADGLEEVTNHDTFIYHGRSIIVDGQCVTRVLDMTPITERGLTTVVIPLEYDEESNENKLTPGRELNYSLRLDFTSVFATTVKRYTKV